MLLFGARRLFRNSFRELVIFRQSPNLEMGERVRERERQYPLVVKNSGERRPANMKHGPGDNKNARLKKEESNFCFFFSFFFGVGSYNYIEIQKRTGISNAVAVTIDRSC